MKVKNIPGTSGRTCSCGSWLQHWEKYSGQLSLFCTVEECYNTASVGAHVRKMSAIDSKQYIIPMCNKHNATTEELSIKTGTIFVSANKSETCG